MEASSTRRELIGAVTGAAGVAALAACSTAPLSAQSAPTRSGDPFIYCLNASTIRGQKLSLAKEVEVAAQAGFDAFEPWLGKMADHEKNGGKLEDLAKRCKDLNLRIASAIGFAKWIVDDPTERAQGLEQAKRDMDMVKRMGGSHIAAPPIGAHKGGKKLDLFVVAERYRALLEVGRQIGVVPELEVWGFSTNLSRLGEAAFVAAEAGHPDACILPDVYHVYKGGSRLEGLKILSKTAVPCFHINDYPADPPRETINDSHRVYPGDGVAPLDMIFSTLASNGLTCALSLELFNRDLWKKDALEVAKTGLLKSKAAVARALKLG